MDLHELPRHTQTIGRRSISNPPSSWIRYRKRNWEEIVLDELRKALCGQSSLANATRGIGSFLSQERLHEKSYIVHESRIISVDLHGYFGKFCSDAGINGLR